MEHSEIAPIIACRFAGGVRQIPDVVDTVLGRSGLAGMDWRSSPEMIEVLGLALTEVLHTIDELCGALETGADSGVELWVEPSLLIICVRYSGRGLPPWLLANWDRAQEPAILAPSSDTGWGWLLVREALDGVATGRRGADHLVFLEKRL